MSRITRSASAASGTFSTKLVVTLPPSSASTALRALSCANVQPASPTGPTYPNATSSGAVAAGGGARVDGADPVDGDPPAGSRLLQPTVSAMAAAITRVRVRVTSMVIS